MSTEDAILTASDTAAGDSFGRSVGISSDTIIVGAYQDDDNGSGSGSAYVFALSGSTWSQQQKLTPSDGAAGDEFGISVAIYGNTAVVGAWFDDDGGSASGSAYVFVRSGGVWTQQQKLTASDAASSDNFGASVAISIDTIVIGAQAENSNRGSAYVFVRSGGVWTQQQKLTASDAAVDDLFGVSVAIDDDTIVVGAQDDDFGVNPGSGAAYVFTRSGSVWTQQAKLTPADRSVVDFFGIRVAISGDTVVVSELQQLITSAVYVFVKPGSGWSNMTETAQLTVAENDDFGRDVSLSYGVSISNSIIVAGAFNYNHTTALSNDGSGAAYVFSRPGGGWSNMTETRKLTSSDAATGDHFGFAVGVSGDSVVVGPSAKESAYVFGLDLVTGACCAADGSCTVTLASACTGDWQGADTTCSPNPCPQVPVPATGACCQPDGSCEVLTEAACAAASGTYRGDTTDCSPNPCECEPGHCPPSCDPDDCDPKCCCCESTDIVSEIKFRCHKQIALSCNADGTAPGPDLDPFPSGCTGCHHGCETVLGIGSHSGLDCDDLISHGTGEGWWNLPFTAGPCECNCAIPGSPCQLTCVTCAGLFCESNVEISASDCAYNITLSPGSGCCGSPALIDWMFVIDFSASMGGDIANVRNQVVLLVNKLRDENGATVRFGLVVFGKTTLGDHALRLDFTSDVSALQSALTEATDGGAEADIEAVKFAAELDGWGGASANYIMLIADEASQGNTDIQSAVDACALNNIIVYVVDGGTGNVQSPQRGSLAIATGGSRFDLGQPFSNIVADLSFTSLPSDCRCVDQTPVPVRISTPECMCCKDGQTNPCIDDHTDTECINSLPDYCFNIPIKRCLLGQDDCDCTQSMSLNVCGNTVVVSPIVVNQTCCSNLGCDCPVISTTEECCGPTCPGSEICDNGQRLYNSLQEAQDAVWCECFTKAAFVSTSTPLCTHCCCPDIEAGRGHPSYPCDKLAADDPLLAEEPPRCCECASAHAEDCCSCCLNFADSTGGTTKVKCKPEIDTEVQQIWETCGSTAECPNPPCIPLPDWEPSDIFMQCPDDKCINGQDPLSGTCVHTGCTPVRNPDVAVLNNGVGLVAYESSDDVSVIKIQQFKTSIVKKILPNREFNFGRLQNQVLWSNGIAKLYYYEDVPTHLINSQAGVDLSDTNTWRDVIGFRNGPLANRVFPLIENPLGEDEIGKHISFLASTEQVSADFPSADDVYNIRWFIFDFDDEGVVGTATDESTDGSEFIINDRSVIDNALLLPSHIYNGEKVSVANPRLDVMRNYNNALENSHFVNLVYQAMEDKKWNVYLRQIRLSEYQRDEHIDENISTDQIVEIESLGVDEVVYKIVCVNDTCLPVGSEYSLKRTVTMSVLLKDGREVLNPSLTGNWSGLCPGVSESEFDKNKVFVQFIQSAVSDRCIDISDFNDVFYNWKAGQIFIVPVGSISASTMLVNMKLTDDSGLDLGQFDPPVEINNAIISSSSASIIYYESFLVSRWSVIDNSAFQLLSKFKGFDIGEPILLTEADEGHSTHPVVRSDYRNNIFVVYETTINGLQQIKLVGTVQPTSILPVGYFNAKKIDATLNYFLSPTDFIYSLQITPDTSGMNQLPDMFIDLNDVIHLTWQSNRDGLWEIYYTNSESDFEATRITKSSGRSLCPRITTDISGRVFIVWHDDRFGNYEIMMAFNQGQRILPLSQQDPYLASMRNNYRHFLDAVELTITNTSSDPVCYTNLIVDFFEERSLKTKVATVDQDTWPFAFSVIGSSNDTTTKEFETFSDWGASTSELVDPYDPYTPELSTFKILTGPEYDSGIFGSVINSINLSVFPLPVHGAKYLDRFNRIDGVLGSDWSSSDIEISNSEAFISNDSATTRFQSATETAQQSVSVNSRVSLLASSLSNSSITLLIRSNSGGTTRYEVSISTYNHSSNAYSYITARRTRNSISTVIETIYFADQDIISETNKEFKAICTDGLGQININVFVDDVLFASIADVSPLRLTSGTYGGFGLSTSSSNLSIYASSFSLFDLAQSPGEFYVEVSFKSSDTANDVNSQWSEWFPISAFNEDILFSSLSTQEFRGRYKQSRVRFNYYSTDEYSDVPDLSHLFIESMSPHRICLAPGASTIATLDLTPPIKTADARLEHENSSPIPLSFMRNDTYFVSVSAKNEDGDIVVLPSQSVSVSCSDCFSQDSTWNLTTCSLKIDLVNNTAENKFYNLTCAFYRNKEKTQLAVTYQAIANHSDLAYFTVDDTQQATDAWTSVGLRVNKDNQRTVVLWPTLSSTSGLLCGISYYVTIKVCSAEDTAEQACSDMKTHSSVVWRCACESSRWAPELEQFPVNIRDMRRWKSSAHGAADTRMTETIGINNLNPVIRIRSNSDGLIVYESNRTDMAVPGSAAAIYASVFSMVPASNMYASGAESIISPFSQTVVRSDIPIKQSGSDTVISGRNVACDIDQYDNLFIATEEPATQTECKDFIADQSQLIRVHACGADEVDFQYGQTSEELETSKCDPQSILGSFVSFDSEFKDLIQKVRVKDDLVVNYATIDGVTSPVVNQCDIRFIIVGSPESIAVRFRNGQTSSWSEWIAFSPEVGDNTIEAPLDVPWSLSNGIGLKSVQMQVASYAGLTGVGTLKIIGDYRSVAHEIRFYKPLPDEIDPPPAIPDLSNSNIWSEINSLSSLNNIPVASMRPPKSVETPTGKSIVINQSDYIFIEIIPNTEYMKQFADIPDDIKLSDDLNITPTFDFIQQGGIDQSHLPTIWARKDGVEVFRGFVEIRTDNDVTFKDGLANIIAHFKNDCSDTSEAASASTSYSKDQYNVMSGTADTTTEETLERDDFGRPIYTSVIRPTNLDPYLIFGDPNIS